MSNRNLPYILIVCGMVAVGLFLLGTRMILSRYSVGTGSDTPLRPAALQPSPTPTPTIHLAPLPETKILENDGYHVFQTFNNCGPASLSMSLSYYGISVSQQELGNMLRPFQNPQGDNDDKSVTLAEIADKSGDFGFIPYHRPGGTMDHIKQFVAHDMPVITRTLTKPTEDIGHFRIVKGYDERSGMLIQDDSLQGANLRFSYDDFSRLWETFGFEFLVLVPQDKIDIADAIVGPDADERFAWQRAADGARAKTVSEPDNRYARFNLSVALYHVGDFEGSVAAFESVENELPMRTLWYQADPIRSYYELGMYDRVFAITDRIIAGGNRAASELYMIRGNSFLRQNDPVSAGREFRNAIYYNSQLKEAKAALEALP